jgi:hypothetical protein
LAFAVATRGEVDPCGVGAREGEGGVSFCT